MKETSKFLSYVLRHAPESIGLALDANGWASVDDLLAKAKQAGQTLDRDLLLRVVAESDKKRFTLSADGARIRAAQGHSVDIDLGLTPADPPDVLFHGTAEASVATILSDGLRPQSRRQVHLSADRETARRVGQRHGRPVVLVLDAARMRADGFVFFRADNGVWLTDHAPAVYVRLEAGDPL